MYLLLLNSDMTKCCEASMHYVNLYFHQVKEAFPDPLIKDNQTLHDLESGGCVFWKQCQRKIALTADMQQNFRTWVNYRSIISQPRGAPLDSSNCISVGDFGKADQRRFSPEADSTIVMYSFPKITDQDYSAVMRLIPCNFFLLMLL